MSNTDKVTDFIDRKMKLKNILLAIIAALIAKMVWAINSIDFSNPWGAYHENFFFLVVILVIIVLIYIPLYLAEIKLEDKQDVVLTEKTIRRPETVRQQLLRAQRDIQEQLQADKERLTESIVDAKNFVEAVDIAEEKDIFVPPTKDL